MAVSHNWVSPGGSAHGPSIETPAHSDMPCPCSRGFELPETPRLKEIPLDFDAIRQGEPEEICTRTSTGTASMSEKAKLRTRAMMVVRTGGTVAKDGEDNGNGKTPPLQRSGGGLGSGCSVPPAPPPQSYPARARGMDHRLLLPRRRIRSPGCAARDLVWAARGRGGVPRLRARPGADRRSLHPLRWPPDL